MKKLPQSAAESQRNNSLGADKADKDAQRDCRDMPILRRVWAQLTPKFALDTALLGTGQDIYAIQIFWHPDYPSAEEMKLPVIANALEHELQYLQMMALKHAESGVA